MLSVVVELIMIGAQMPAQQTLWVLSQINTLKSLEQPSKNCVMYAKGGSGDGVSISYLFNMHDLLPRPPYYIKSSHNRFDKN